MSNPQVKKSEFKTEAFRYLVGGGSVYVKCFVRVCLATETSEECTLCSNARKRRDVGSTSMMKSRSFADGAGDVALVQSEGFYIIEDDRGRCYYHFVYFKVLQRINLFNNIFG